MSRQLRIEGTRFVDDVGRTVLLRGVNVSGSTKLPREGSSFVGRPFPLSEADVHFDRLRRFGLTCVRLLVSWEAVEYLGPRRYDADYLDYLEALVGRAGDFGLDVFLDFHQDVWSRFTGGDGAPRWTLEAVGLDPDALHETGAAFLAAEHSGPPPKMIWQTNGGKLAAATMFTLFFGGEAFAPRTKVDGESAQRFLREHFYGALEQVVRRVAPFPHVFGVDLFNEPTPGYIGWADLRQPRAPAEVGLMPSPLEGFALGMGHSITVREYHRGLLGPRVVARRTCNPRGRRAWKAGQRCVWLEHGVWADEETPRLLAPDYFTRVAGRQVSFADDFLAPFLAEAAARVHRVAPRLAAVLEGEALHAAPAWTGAGPAVWAPHWYDGYVLFMKDFRSFLAADAFTQRPVFGAGRIRRSFAAQLGRLRDEGTARGLPTLIGELGVAFDLRGQPGDEALATRALDRTLTAVEDALVSATLWNYTPENTHAAGDGWNGEDLSVVSLDAPHPDRGRALDALLRPRPLAVAGRPLRLAFDRRTRRFELVVQPDPSVRAPTEVYLPRHQYPQGAEVRVSSGEAKVDAEAQRVWWTHAGSEAGTLTVAPLG